MKKITVLVLFVSTCFDCMSQLEWPNYSTSFDSSKNARLGVAIPYNGNYNNVRSSTVGITRWNPRDSINLDPALPDKTPLLLIYDTSAIYILLPSRQLDPAVSITLEILLDNKYSIPLSRLQVGQTANTIGIYPPGIPIVGPIHAGWGKYLVLRTKESFTNKSSMMVLYWNRPDNPAVKSVFTSNQSNEFKSLLSGNSNYEDDVRAIGWHREYVGSRSYGSSPKKFNSDETTLLINIDERLFKKSALEFCLYKSGTVIRNWGANEYDNNRILLKNLNSGDYELRIRLARDRSRVSQFPFTIAKPWYKSAAFIIAFFLFICVMIFGIVLFLSLRQKKRALKVTNTKYRKTSSELEGLYSTLNPHFTFNALSSIQSLINQNQIEKANVYLTSFSSLLRAALDLGKHSLIPLARELETINNYIKLEQLRFMFAYVIEVDSGIDMELTEIPPMLLQPFVENAIKHGLNQPVSRGIVKIVIGKLAQTMTIEIIDNGRGFDVLKSLEGHGLTLSKRRIFYLNQEYNEELIYLTTSSDNNGTNVKITFNKWIQ